MNLKRYRVKNIKEALAFIKRDLGPDALIVSSRQVKEGKGAFGMFGKTMLEVTAAASEAKNHRYAQTPLKQRRLIHTDMIQNYLKRRWPKPS